LLSPLQKAKIKLYPSQSEALERVLLYSFLFKATVFFI
jgi:hypothetical protein